ncbi:hypothetical protein GCM10010401_15810 [Rarobacter faecitabidus]|uniref:Uncharacterized protein n=1 Tax=Rarobacter faecitabidus TaxID=13243 RepID=A0A542ZXD5_RARFA|nr:hypothetical protein [Rarobacter faecitabidus]TQL65017.1 hypothetical protein FB461_1550 [Rarobacter faecitabidus]
MTDGPNYYDPKELFGNDYGNEEGDDYEEGQIEISPSEDGEGFDISGSVEDVLEFFTAGLTSFVEQIAVDGELTESQVSTVIKSVAQIREALELD